MKKYLSIFLIFCIISIAEMAAAPNYRVKASSLTVRLAPNVQAPALGKLSLNQDIEVISISKGWAKIVFRKGIGFVSSKYLVVLNKPQQEGPTQLSQENNSTSNSLQSGQAIQQDTTANQNSELHTSDSSEVIEYNDDLFIRDRIEAFFELDYTASSFKDVRRSGYYGIGWTRLEWKLYSRLYLGFHCAPLNFNFGLVDSDSAGSIIRLGPAIGYYFAPNVFVSMPIDICMSIIYSGKSDTTLGWGMIFTPSIYIGKKFGVSIGPALSIPFTKNASVSAGFRAGIVLNV